MRVLFVRHAIAEDREQFAATGKSDDHRPLTPQGRDKMQQAASGLYRVMPDVELLATSPLTRAAETAAIVAKAYGNLKPVELDVLSPGSRPHELLSWLQTLSVDAVALVGHEPDLSCAVSWLLTGREEPVVEFKKGAACLLEFGGTVDVCNAVLLWAMRPAQLRRLGESSAAGKTDRHEDDLERASSERGSPAMARGKGRSGEPNWKDERHRQKSSRKEEKTKAKLSRKQAKQARKRASRSQHAVVGFDNRVELPKVVAVIQDLLTGFQGGSVSVESADQNLTVSPCAVVEFRVRARQTHKRESIMLRVRWPRTSVSEETASLRVSS